jgi:hypothetical protein
MSIAQSLMASPTAQPGRAPSPNASSPRAPPLGHQRRIGVQVGPVGLIGHRAQHGAFGLAGVGQQGQRLITVAGQNDLVEEFPPGIGDHGHTRPSFPAFI